MAQVTREDVNGNDPFESARLSCQRTILLYIARDQTRAKADDLLAVAAQDVEDHLSGCTLGATGAGDVNGGPRRRAEPLEHPSGAPPAALGECVVPERKSKGTGTTRGSDGVP